MKVTIVMFHFDCHLFFLRFFDKKQNRRCSLKVYEKTATVNF